MKRALIATGLAKSSLILLAGASLSTILVIGCGQAFEAGPAGSGGGSTTTMSGPSSSSSSGPASSSSSSGAVCGAMGEGQCMTVPQGWTAVLAESAKANAQLADCDPMFPTSIDYFADPKDPNGGCDCTCGSLSGEKCGDLQSVTLFEDNGCQGNSSVVSPLLCASTPAAEKSIKVVQNVTSHGACPPDVQAKLGAGQWSQKARTCSGATLAGTCPTAGDVCEPKPAGGFQGCIAQAGDSQVCPAGYSNHNVVYSGTGNKPPKIDDSRKCTNAGCSCVPTVDCQQHVVVASNGICTMNAMEIPADGGCYDVDFDHIAGLMAGSPQGSCAPMGTATMTGKLSGRPAEATTICCP